MTSNATLGVNKQKWLRPSLLHKLVDNNCTMLDSHQIDFVHHFAETAVSLLSLVFNSFLLYLIAKHSNFGSPVYQTLLAIDAGLDLVLAFFVFLGQTVVITGGGYLVYISNGFLSGWSHQLDMMLIFLWLWLIHLNVMWIPIQFIYRYTFICLSETEEKRGRAKKVNTATAVGASAWALVGLSMTYIYSHSYAGFQMEGRHVLALNSWEVAQGTLVVGSNLKEWKMQLFIGMWFVTCIGAIVVVAFVETRIAGHFSAMGNAIHLSTRKMHKDFHRALLAMAVTPLLTTTAPILYYLVAALIELSPGPMQCFLSMACTSITMFNPLTTIFFMRCYRKVVFRACCRERVRDSATATRITGLSMAVNR